MSPLNITILLHYFWSPTDYRARFEKSEPEHAESDGVANAICWLVTDGLLKSRFGDLSWAAGQSPSMHPEAPLFSITDKGRAMVDHLMHVQVPVCQWVQP